MKKTLLTLCSVLLAAVAMACTDDDRIITYDKLPAEAKNLIEQHFAQERVALVSEDREWFGSSYEVKFVNGGELKFDSEGRWSDIDCAPAAVPTALLPAQILQKVERDFGGRKVVKIDRDRRDYEVKLEGGLELTFDLKFNLIDLDD